MRFPARPATGLAVFLAYLVVFFSIWIVGGIEYSHVSDSAATIAKWYVAPLAGGAVVLVLAATVLGWWRPILFELQRATPRWLLVAPIAMAVMAVITLFTKDYSDTTGAMVVLLIIGSLTVLNAVIGVTFAIVLVRRERGVRIPQAGS